MYPWHFTTHDEAAGAPEAVSHRAAQLPLAGGPSPIASASAQQHRQVEDRQGLALAGRHASSCGAVHLAGEGPLGLRRHLAEPACPGAERACGWVGGWPGGEVGTTGHLVDKGLGTTGTRSSAGGRGAVECAVLLTRLVGDRTAAGVYDQTSSSRLSREPGTRPVKGRRN